MLQGNKTYLVAAGIVLTGFMEGGLLTGSIDWGLVANYFFGGAALAAVRSALKKQEV